MGKPESIDYDNFKKGLEATKKAISELDVKQAYIFRMNNIFMRNSNDKFSGVDPSEARDRFAVSRLPKLEWGDTSDLTLHDTVNGSTRVYNIYNINENQNVGHTSLITHLLSSTLSSKALGRNKLYSQLGGPIGLATSWQKVSNNWNIYKSYVVWEDGEAVNKKIKIPKQYRVEN